MTDSMWRTDLIDTPSLDRLIGAYVNEDWPSLYPSVWAAVDDFVASAPRLAASLPSEIDAITRAFPGEADLAKHLDRLGIGYDPQPEDHGFHGWLAQVRRRAAK